MDSEKEKLITELKDFYKKLKTYNNYVRAEEQLSQVQTRYRESLRETLVRKSGALKSKIIELTGRQYAAGPLTGKFDIWIEAFNTSGIFGENRYALDFCVDATNEAIGNLGAEHKVEEEKSANKELELVLNGTPDMILKCIQDTAERPNSKNYTYHFHRTSGTPDYATWDKTYFVSCAISLGDEGHIGTIKLQLLPKEKTIVKYLEPENWDSSFGYFINLLLIEFKKLGFIEQKIEEPISGTEIKKSFMGNKLWQWIESHKIISILGAVASIATIIGVIITLLKD